MGTPHEGESEPSPNVIQRYWEHLKRQEADEDASLLSEYASKADQLRRALESAERDKAHAEQLFPGQTRRLDEQEQSIRAALHAKAEQYHQRQKDVEDSREVNRRLMTAWFESRFGRHQKVATQVQLTGSEQKDGHNHGHKDGIERDSGADTFREANRRLDTNACAAVHEIRNVAAPTNQDKQLKHVAQVATTSTTVPKTVYPALSNGTARSSNTPEALQVVTTSQASGGTENVAKDYFTPSEPQRTTFLQAGGKQDAGVSMGIEQRDAPETPDLDTGILQHDGKVYTHPEMMKGVPVEKIGPRHAYWDDEWKTDDQILTQISQSLPGLKAKSEYANNNRTESRYSMSQRVRRAESILARLPNLPFSPYQLLAKPYVSNSLTSFDNMFRLLETYEVLLSYRDAGTLPVQPLDWLRLRLHEIWQEKQSGFALHNVIGDFYRDPKFQELRQVNGGKTTGRPYKGDDTRGSKAKSRTKDNRKALATGKKDKPPSRAIPKSTEAGPSPIAEAEIFVATSSSGTRKQGGTRKRERESRDNETCSDDVELEYDDYTDTDEFSQGSLTSCDFALHCVKSRLSTSPGNVTQYWTWTEQNDGWFFEHQVLMECEPEQPVEWGTYSKGVATFHIEPGDVEEVLWAPQTLRVIIRASAEEQTRDKDGKPRGQLQGEFRSERSKRRFVSLCIRESLTVIKMNEYALKVSGNLN